MTEQKANGDKQEPETEECEDCEGRGTLWKTWNQDVPEPLCLLCDGTGRMIKRTAKP